MSSIMHCRKHSLSYKYMSIQEKQIPHQRQIDFIRSLQQTPKSRSLFWLTRNMHNLREQTRCGSAITSQTKFKRLASSDGKRLSKLNNQYHNGVLRPLEKVTGINLQTALYIVETALKECITIHQKLGYSFFSIRNCYLNKQDKLIIDFNSPYTQVAIQNSDQTVIVRDIMEQIHKICTPKCFDDFYNYYKRISAKNRCDFKYMISLIKSYCKCSKIYICDRVNKNENIPIEGNYDLKNHPRSAELIQQKVRAIREGGKLQKLVQNKKIQRKSFYRKQFQNQKKQNINQIKYRQQNKIKQQFNLIINPNLSSKYLQLSGDKNSITSKQSTISTNFQSSMLHPQSIDTNINNFANKLLSTNLKNDLLMAKSSQNRFYLFLPADLDQVQSLGQSSDPQQQVTQVPSRQFQTPRDSHFEQIKKQNQQRILSINKWTRKFHDLLHEQTDIKQKNIGNGSDSNHMIRISLKQISNEITSTNQHQC